MEWREYDGYLIVHAIPVNGKEMVLGVHLEKGSQFATWEYHEEEYLWAHYFTDQVKATQDLCKRTLEEIKLMENRDMDRESTYGFTGFLKNGNNRGVIDFPTNELQDILGSIGIMEDAGSVLLNGPYHVELEPGRDKFADALIHVMGENVSLRTVNEVAKAAYHSDYRIYFMLEEKLKYGQYHSAEELLADVEERRQQIKKTSPEKAR